ncbi:MAG: elongation factor P [Chloroflexi bacterium]|nr:MAG: elongation factor P [Chloroflexota bacterium]TMC69949.1 MAG: elongation factor P [Chloroflexota bacterium]
MISTSDFRNGTMFEMDGQLLSVVNVEHIKLARAGAVIKAKLRNVMTGSIFEHSFRSGDKYKTVRIDKKEATYLYADGSHHYFMDTQTYDQVAVDEEMVESVLPFLKEGSPAYLLRHEDRLIGVELPITVELRVVDTDPGFKGDTVSGATKPARLETGAKIQVPLFIQPGDLIRVDTRTGTYMERA